MTAPLGHLLVRNGVLNDGQVRRALDEQARTGVPFGVACEQLFSIDPRDIEDAWADQYAGLTRTVDLRSEQVDPAATGIVERRQAWQFGVFPVRWDGGELMVATTSSLLVRAHRFMSRHRSDPVYFVMTSREGLVDALQRAYPLPGAVLPRPCRRGDRSAA
ncbi:MAG: hypothetical protein QF733_02650 [Phycisphaerales bacterium]|jgi:hypothetical protein|nr:hypothetical protein [Phycisphaerales bacterium]